MENPGDVKGGGGGVFTLKYPSDIDEEVTLKYPSDNDEDAVTMKYPSDGDDDLAI